MDQKLQTVTYIFFNIFFFVFKSAFSDLRQYLATENPLKLRKNAFNFILKAFFILNIFKFLS